MLTSKTLQHKVDNKRVNVKRAVLLQTVATNRKNKLLKKFMKTATVEFNRLLSERKGCRTFMQFHHKTLSASKRDTSFNVQVRCSLIRDAWKKKTSKVNGLTVKFNIPRNCKTFRTKSNFFVELGVYPRKRIAIPIKQNRNYQRFQSLIQEGWTCKTFGLTRDSQIVAYLCKEKEIPKSKNILGIDVNSKHFAISVISPKGKVLYQTYLGKHIWNKRKKILERRTLLQPLNFIKKLRRLRRKERNFVKTNLGQLVREIIKIAKKYGTDIAIENLRKFSPKGRRFNKEVMTIPFYSFKKILEQRCFDNNIHLDVVDGWHTSKWCSHCGAVGKGHSSNYSLFRCKECGQIVNSDRKASLAIAVKSLLEREDYIPKPDIRTQISKRRVPVNGLLRSNESGLSFAEHHTQPLEGMPTPLRMGSLLPSQQVRCNE